MSAWIVKDKTINIIVTHLAFDPDGHWLKEKFKEAGYDLDTEEGRWKLGCELFSLNMDSVNQRYGDNQAETFRKLDYQYEAIRKPKIHAFKSLHCWRYQSCEGDVDQKELFKLMEKVESSWASHIVSDLPEYDQADAWE